MIAFLNPHSIKFRFTALGIGLVLIGLVARLILGPPVVSAQVQELIAAQQHSIASYIARDVDQHIHMRLNNIEALAQQLPPALLADPARLQHWIQERQRSSPLFNSGLMVVHPEGRGLLGEFPVIPGRAGLDYRHSDWFAGAWRAHGAVLGRPARGRASGDPLIIMAAAVRDDRGNPRAILAGVSLLNTRGFLDKFMEARLGDSGGYALVSPADKLIIAASDPELVLQPTPAPGLDALHDRAMMGFRGSGVSVNAQGVEELATMVEVPHTGWFVVARIPMAEALKPATALRQYSLRTSLVVLMLLSVLFMLLLPRLLRPLDQASSAIRAMADGRQPLAPLPLERQDEVGQLVRGFNLLVDRLQTQEAALKASEAHLAFMAHHDPLTRLPNRTLLETRLQLAVAQSARPGHRLALLFCDLDGFKAINDQYGHEVGDSILIQVAERLLDGRRSGDTVARLGGDEFVLLLTGLERPEQAARAVAEQCLAGIRRPFPVQALELHLGISIGITVHGGGEVSVSHLLSQADMAMYQAKRAGKNGLAFYQEPPGPA